MSAAAEDVATPFRRSVAEDLMTLAVLHDRELERDRILALWEVAYEDFLGLRLENEAGREALALFRNGLTDIPGALDQATLDLLAAEYADIYLNNGFGASPCESVWIDEDGLTMQEPMFQIREYYRRHGLSVRNWRVRTDDHLVHQLHFIAAVLESGGGDDDLREVARFMDEHILRWIWEFAERVALRASTRFYAGLARLTAVYLDVFRDVLAEWLEEPRPSAGEIDERMRPTRSVAVDLPQAFVPGVEPSW